MSATTVAPNPHGQHSHGPGAPERSRADRVSSFDPADFPPVSGREEDWRFTPLDRLRGLLDGPPPDGALTLSADLPDGVRLDVAAPGDPRRLAGPAPADLLAALAVTRSAEGATVVRVEPGAEPDRPVVLRLRGEGGTAWGHLIVDVGAGARATVVVEHTGSAVYGFATSVLVGDGAQLTFVSIAEWEPDAVHAGHLGFRLGRDASLRSTTVTLGGDLVRLVETVEYTAPGGNADLSGLYFADAGQHLEHRLFVDHAVPRCRSNVVYKGALQGDDAHTVWVGDVLIRAAAEGTDTYELNRNLVLTEGARADSVPNLEIETGEIVGAGHASATGRFDDEQLFYLQARGIPESQARRLVVRGFFNELIQQIGVPEVAERLLAAIEAELSNSMGLPSSVSAEDQDEADRSETDRSETDREATA
ncbi:MAG: Fe-S cluster assembly protein SufD [Actinomycetota bacterium]|nr:Fe-S cluster assembly protein SufD [Actinomycetota bacterium]